MSYLSKSTEDGNVPHQCTIWLVSQVQNQHCLSLIFWGQAKCCQFLLSQSVTSREVLCMQKDSCQNDMQPLQFRSDVDGGVPQSPRSMSPSTLSCNTSMPFSTNKVTTSTCMQRETFACSGVLVSRHDCIMSCLCCRR